MSVDDRRAERRALLLDAAYHLLGSDGYASLTVRSVFERAELNPRYFYESFDDLDELVVAVYEHVVDELAAVVMHALEGTSDDAAAQVRAVVEGIVEFVDEDRRRGRVLYVEALGNEALNKRRIEAGQAVVAFIERYAAERSDRTSGDHVGRVGAAILVGGFTELLIDWLAGSIPATRTQLVDDATELFLALGDAAAGIASRRRPATPARLSTLKRKAARGSS
ncbi:MAG TPA: TetR/AcrR family transcriptional regulator [Acidimicrobiales bacterium]|jgi:AcrR family transcriptional regulator|nr:TetR/AcrR family transcriptional regulator [Acidimicrobiales bacterium]